MMEENVITPNFKYVFINVFLIYFRIVNFFIELPTLLPDHIILPFSS